jgi:hypothetical protein
MGRGAGAPRTGGTPKSYHSRHPAQAHLRTCFQTRERLPQPRFFLAAHPPVHRHSERSLRSEVRFCIARLLCDESLFDPPHAENSLSSRPERPRFCRACIHCHPDRSDPIFSSAPQCGASGRAVEGSRHNPTVEQSLPLPLSPKGSCAAPPLSLFYSFTSKLFHFLPPRAPPCQKPAISILCPPTSNF